MLIITEIANMVENSRLPEGTYLKTGVILQVMDIEEPLEALRCLLERRLGVDLSCFQIWLQDKAKVSQFVVTTEKNARNCMTCSFV